MHLLWDCNCTPMYVLFKLTPMHAWRQRNTRLWIDFDFGGICIWNGVVLALDNQSVRALVLVHFWIRWCDYLLGVESTSTWHDCNHMLFKYTTMATTHTRFRVDFDFGGIYGTVSCWLWTSSMYVSISAFLNLLVWLLNYWHMARSRLHTHTSCVLQIHYNNGDNTRLRIGLILILME